MGARRKTPDIAGELALNLTPSGIAVGDFGRFLASCQSALKGAFRGELRWMAIDRAIQNVRYLSDGRAFAQSKSDNVPVLPLTHDQQLIPTHWIAIGLTADLVSEPHFVTHASMKIYQGALATDVKRLRFRAEWDPIQSLSIEHGQPHWHFHEEPLESFVDESSLNSLVEERPAKTRYHHVHFPMAARFHEGLDRCVIDNASSELLKKWLVSSIRYLRNELEQTM